jgi:hypothetical protein
MERANRMDVRKAVTSAAVLCVPLHKVFFAIVLWLSPDESSAMEQRIDMSWLI